MNRSLYSINQALNNGKSLYLLDEATTNTNAIQNNQSLSSFASAFGGAGGVGTFTNINVPEPLDINDLIVLNTGYFELLPGGVISSVPYLDIGGDIVFYNNGSITVMAPNNGTFPTNSTLQHQLILTGDQPDSIILQNTNQQPNSLRVSATGIQMSKLGYSIQLLGDALNPSNPQGIYMQGPNHITLSDVSAGIPPQDHFTIASSTIITKKYLDISTLGTFMNGLVAVSGTLNVLGTLGVTGDFGLTGGDMSITGNFGLSGGDMSITGNVGITGDFGLTGGDMSITGDILLLGNLGVTGDIGLLGNLGITGDIGLLGNLGITGDISMLGNLGVTGDIGLLGNLGITGNIDMTGNIGLTGDINMTGNFGLTGGDVTILGDVGITGHEFVNGNLDVSGNVGITGNVGIGGILSVGQIDVVAVKVDYIEPYNNTQISMVGDVGVTGNMNITGFVGITGDVSMTGDFDMIGNLGITGNANITGTLTAGSFQTQYLYVDDIFPFSGTQISMVGNVGITGGNFGFTGAEVWMYASNNMELGSDTNVILYGNQVTWIGSNMTLALETVNPTATVLIINAQYGDINMATQVGDIYITAANALDIVTNNGFLYSSGPFGITGTAIVSVTAPDIYINGINDVFIDAPIIGFTGDVGITGDIFNLSVNSINIKSSLDTNIDAIGNIFIEGIHNVTVGSATGNVKLQSNSGTNYFTLDSSGNIDADVAYIDITNGSGLTYTGNGTMNITNSGAIIIQSTNANILALQSANADMYISNDFAGNIWIKPFGILGITGYTAITGNVGITGDVGITGALYTDTIYPNNTGIINMIGEVGITGDSVIVGNVGVTGNVNVTGTVYSNAISTNTMTLNNLHVDYILPKTATDIYIVGDVGITGDLTIMGTDLIPYQLPIFGPTMDNLVIVSGSTSSYPIVSTWKNAPPSVLGAFFNQNGSSSISGTASTTTYLPWYTASIVTNTLSVTTDVTDTIVTINNMFGSGVAAHGLFEITVLVVLDQSTVISGGNFINIYANSESIYLANIPIGVSYATYTITTLATFPYAPMTGHQSITVGLQCVATPITIDQWSLSIKQLSI